MLQFLIILPTFIYANLYSPQDINPSDLNTDAFTSISKEANFITDLGFREQKNLADEILSAVGDLTFSVELLKHDFDLDGTPSSVNLDARLNVDRRVYVTNLGDIDKEGIPLSPIRSVYTVVDEGKNELRFESEINTSSVLRIQPIHVHAGVSVKRVYEVDNLEDYRKRKSIENSLQEIGLDIENNKNVTSSYTKKSGSMLKSFNKVLDLVESVFRRGSDYFADEERSRIFLENVLDPIRLDAEFFHLTAEKLKNSKSVQVGEVLVHSTYLRLLPMGLAAVQSPARAEFYPKAYTIIIHSAFKKISETEVIAKSILEIRKGREFKFRVELFGTGYDPIRLDLNSYNFEVNEYGYKFDLAKSEHAQAFDDIFTKRWFTKNIKDFPRVVQNIESLQNKDYIIFTKDKTSPIRNIENQFKAELLIATARNKSFRLIEKVVNRPVEGDDITEYIGRTGRTTKFGVRLGFRNMKEDEQSTKLLNSYVRLQDGHNAKAELTFEYLFSDRYTNQHEFKAYVDFLKMAIAAKDLQANSEAIRNITKALDQRVLEKQNRKDSQYLALRLSLSTAVTNAIFNNPENLENIKFLIGKLLLGNRYTKWSDVTNPKANHLRFPEDCSQVVENKSYLVFDATENYVMTCRRLAHTATNMYNAFADIVATNDPSEKLNILNAFYKQRNFRAYVPLIILQLATIEKIEDGVATFSSIDDLINNSELGIELVVDGNGLEFPLRLDFDNTTVLRRVQLNGDFNFMDVNGGERRLQERGAFIRSNQRAFSHPKVYLRLNSNIDFSARSGASYRFVGVLKDYRFGRADKVLTSFDLNIVSASEEHHRGFDDKKAFSYILVVPNGEKVMLNKKQDYIVELRVVDQDNNFVTETTELKFSIK